MRSLKKLTVKAKNFKVRSFQWLNLLSIKHKITLGYIVILLISVSGTGTGILLGVILNRKAEQKIQHNLDELELPQQFHLHILSTQIYQQKLLIESNSLQSIPQRLSLYNYHLNESKFALLELKKHYQKHLKPKKNNPNINSLIKLFEDNQEDINFFLNETYSLHKTLHKAYFNQEIISQNKEKILNLIESPLNQRITIFLIDLDKNIQQISKEHQPIDEILNNFFKLQSLIIILSLCLSILVSILLLNILTTTISQPLQTLQFSVDKASDLIFWLDKTGKLVYANKAMSNYLGYEIQELLFMNIQDFDFYLPTNTWSQFWQELKFQDAIKFESSIRHKIGWESPLEVEINYLEVEGISYGCIFARDITDRKRSENTLILAKNTSDLANKAKSDFLANMSHELRTPLNAVLGFTRLMNRDSNLTPKQLENLQIINRSGEHLLSLINDVLNLSKIESGRITLNPTNFDIYLLLQTLEEIFRTKTDSKGINLIFDYSLDLPQYLKADEQKLRQIFMNLLSNAIKFTDRGGITLRVTSDISVEGKIKIKCEVEDTGYGIADEELDCLFEPFVQTSSGKKVREGTGLGLPISRKFIQLMKGDIFVNSIVNQGTIVKFDFIAEQATANKINNTASARKVIGLKEGQPDYRILIVDDRWENRQILVQLLESVGFYVAEAENGREAISIWSTWNPHLIWMDMRMPVLDGYQATQKIRGNLQGQSTAIIALTASAFEEQKSVILSAGCDDYVSKPFEESTIWDKMTQHLGVNYIYEESKISSKIQGKEVFQLTHSALKVMPTKWIAELEKAALALEEELIAELLQQIPEEHTVLAQALQDKFDNFDFGFILDLARQANTLNTN